MAKAKEEEGLLADTKPFEQYFKFAPDEHHTSPGIVNTPWTGDVQEGDVVVVHDEMRAQILADHPEWKKASKKEFDAQNADQED